MKRIGFLALALCLLLAACAETPERPLVAQKDVDRLIAKAQQPPDGNALSDLVGTTQTVYRWQTSAFQDRIQVTADARIVLPNRDAAPLYRVRAGVLTDNQTRAVAAYLFGDTPAYEFPQDQIVLLKANVQKDLDRLLRRRSAGQGRRSSGRLSSCRPLFRLPWSASRAFCRAETGPCPKRRRAITAA